MKTRMHFFRVLFTVSIIFCVQQMNAQGFYGNGIEANYHQYFGSKQVGNEWQARIGNATDALAYGAFYRSEFDTSLAKNMGSIGADFFMRFPVSASNRWNLSAGVNVRRRSGTGDMGAAFAQEGKGWAGGISLAALFGIFPAQKTWNLIPHAILGFDYKSTNYQFATGPDSKETNSDGTLRLGISARLPQTQYLRFIVGLDAKLERGFWSPGFHVTLQQRK